MASATTAALRPASRPPLSMPPTRRGLDLGLGRPILVVDSTDVDAEGKPLLTTRARFAAERVEFVVDNA